MLWAVLISLILHKQLGKSKFQPEMPVDTEHTPGFYRLDVHRLSEYVAAMENKTISATQKYDIAKQKMEKSSLQLSSSSKKSAMFLKLCAADNNVTKSRQKLTTAIDDTMVALQKSLNNNRNVDAAYGLAYASKFELLKHGLLRSK